MSDETEQPIVWIHGDSLDPNGPALRRCPDAPRVFVFDDEVLERYRISLKRIVFIYECLLEIEGIEVRRGGVAAELAVAAGEHGARRIVTVESVTPRFARICHDLRERYRLAVEVLPLEPFISLARGEAERLDLKRFSRYWQPLKRRALSLNRSFDELI
ncbi:MAG: hypothetical protein EBZ36_16905 [Acidobacteria bacterium]|nr:hypothetical protein [Acidobacteriota bacterium]